MRISNPVLVGSVIAIGAVGAYLVWRQSRVRQAEKLLKKGEDILGVKIEDITDVLGGPYGMAHRNSAPQEDYGWIREVAAVGAAGLTLPLAPITWPIIGVTYVGSRILFPYEKKEEGGGGMGLALPLALGGGALLAAILVLRRRKGT